MYTKRTRMKLITILLVSTSLLFAETLTVNTLSDVGSDGNCSDEHCSLRDAMLDASDGDIINIEVNGVITLSSRLPFIDSTLTINGPGVSNLIISANHICSHFYHSGGVLTLSDMSINDGNVSINADGGAIFSDSSGNMVLKNLSFSNNYGYKGGAIYSRSDLNISQCTFSNNSAKQSGGAIHQFGKLNIQNSTFTENIAASSGGAIFTQGISEILKTDFNYNESFFQGGAIAIAHYNSNNHHRISECTFNGNMARKGEFLGSGYGGALLISSTTLIEKSLFYGNHADFEGGAIFVNIYDIIQEDGINIVNTTFFANQALSFGGAIYSKMTNESLNISHSTITQNQSRDTEKPSGGIYHMEGELNIKSSLISHNYDNGTLADCYSEETSSFNSNRNNIVSEPGNCSFGDYDGILSADQVEILADNGGRTKTCAPLKTSMIVDSGLCTDNSGNLVEVDQRGVRRSDGKCDIGAFELNSLSGILPSMYYLLLN